jgi:hypothetical protein
MLARYILAMIALSNSVDVFVLAPGHDGLSSYNLPVGDPPSADDVPELVRDVGMSVYLPYLLDINLIHILHKVVKARERVQRDPCAMKKMVWDS